ncbi:Predicted dehydrogenase and related protein [Rhodospirillaceae bacterium LM-1]|nr:Predicted dehydrogenase and related protein [Rhodospirillaceae bacterium LM-1]
MIKLGLIGAGRWGRNYIRTIAAMQGVRLDLVASQNPETAALVPEGCRVVPDWQSVAQAPGIQGLIVATPPALHAEMAAVAIEVGLPVLIEKPLTLSLAEASKLRGLAAERSSFVMVDHTHLFNPAFRALCELGLHLGSLKAMWGEAGNYGPFRKDADVLWDWGCHDVAMCLNLAGCMPDMVGAKLMQDKLIEDGIAQDIELSLAFPKGIEARIELSNLRAEKRRRFTAYFDLATLMFDDLAPNKLVLHPPSESFARPEGEGEAIDVAPTSPLELVVREFTDAIKFEREDMHNLDHAVAVVAVLEEAARKMNG